MMMEVVIAKSLISLFCSFGIGGLLWFKKPILASLTPKADNQVLLISWIILRLLPFVLVFVMLDYAPFSDLDGFFGQAVPAARGELVYRDFRCMYAPLFPYLNAVALKFWFSKKAIVLLMILMEGLALWLTNRFYRAEIQSDERIFKSILYLLLPGSLVLCVLGGQEDVWMWLVAVGAFLAWQKTGRLAWFGVVLAFGFLLTKAVFVLFCPALLLLIPKPQKWIIPMAIIGAVAVGFLYYFTQWEFLNQPLNEADTLRAPNWASALNPWVFDKMHIGAKPWNWLGLLTTASVGVWAAYRVRKASFQTAFSVVWIVTYGTMMVAQQSAYSNYIFIFLLPLTFTQINFESRKQIVIFLIFNTLCVVQPSLWWRLGRPIYRNPAAIFADHWHTLDYALQVGIVVGTVYYLWRVLFFLKYKLDSEKSPPPVFRRGI